MDGPKILSRRRPLTRLFLLVATCIFSPISSSGGSLEPKIRTDHVIYQGCTQRERKRLAADDPTHVSLSQRGGGRAQREHFQTISTDKELTRQRRLTVALVGSALMNDSLQVSMLLPMIHSLVTSPPPLGVTANSEVAMGIFFATKDIMQLAAAPLAGVFVARTSARHALLGSTLALGVATLVFGQAQTFGQLLLARATQGAASAAILTGGLTLIAQGHPPEIRGTAMGLAQSGLALGLVTGPLIGGALYQVWGRQITFRVAAAVVLVNALAQWLLLGGIKTSTSSATKEHSKDKTTTALSATPWAQMGQLLRNKQVLLVAAAILVIHAVLGVMKPISQVVLAREFGVSVLARSGVISIATVTYLLSTPLAGRWCDGGLARSKLVAISLFLLTLSTVAFALRVVLGLPVLYLSVALLGTALGISSAASQTLLADLVDQDDKVGEYSMAFALADMADSIGMIVGPILGLSVSQVYGPSVGVGLLGFFCLLLAPFIWNMG